MTPTPYQHTILTIPESWNLLLGGGRGGGKTTAALLVVLRHVEKYGARAKPLIVRETHKALGQVEEELYGLLSAAYPKGVSHNRSEHVFRLPNGAVIELGQIDSVKAYTKYQGRETTLLVVDEFGLFRERRWIDLLKSNLRAPTGVPLREIRTANPGGPLHAFIHRTYVAAAPAWHPFKVDGETWVQCPSIYTDNPHLNHDDYARRLRAATGRDEELARAWLQGDWNIARGAYFGPDLDERVHLLPIAWPYPVTKAWKPFIAMDWGSAAPAVVFVCLRAPGDIGPYPKDSIILLDELSTALPDDPNVGMGWPPTKLAEAIKEMCGRWGVRPEGVADDAMGLEESLFEVLRRHGIWLEKPKKERIAGWQKMRNMLVSARERDGRPGLWIGARCRYFWETAPFVERDAHRPEDLDTAGPDHALDAARYAVMHEPRVARVGRAHGAVR